MTKNHTFKSKLKLIWYFVFVVVFFVGIITIPFINKVYPNIYIAGIYAGDKKKDTVINEIKSRDLPYKITLNLDGSKYEILTSEISYSIDYEESVDRAYNYTSSGNFFGDLINRVKLIFKPREFGLVVNLDDDKLLESLLIVSSKLGTKPVEPSAKIENGQLILDTGKNGVEVDLDELNSHVRKNLSNLDSSEINIKLKEVNTTLSPSELENYRFRLSKLLGKSITLIFEFDNFSINDSALIQFIDPKRNYKDNKIREEIISISKKINRYPQDSVFIVENGTVTEFTPSKDGITVDEDKLVNEIKTQIESLEQTDNKLLTIEVPVMKSPAKIRNEDVNNLGIETLIGRGYSTFKGSISNRIYNVNLAQSKFKGLLIPPGEIVSFNDILGDVSAFTGYKQAYVIMDGKTVLGDGGGVCQVSTTFFRALLSAGLPIIERRAHAYRVGYYEQGFPPGLDATVYSPTTDLKFKNDTPAYILIQPKIDINNLNLTFEIYGTDDGRVATTTKPIITSQTAPPADSYVDDPTLPLGTIKQIEHKAWGAKVIFDYKVVRNGETLIDQRFNSNYRSWGAVFLRGTKI